MAREKNKKDESNDFLAQVLEKKKMIFTLRCQLKVGNGDKKTHLLKHHRRSIARLLTKQSELKNAQKAKKLLEGSDYAS
jgi:ribosomal protein L29